MSFATHWRDAKNGPLDVAAIAREGAVPVIVLPFSVDHANTSEAQSFARSVTHNLTDYLVHYGQLRVVSNESSDQYRAGAVDVARIGRELGAPFAITGQVQLGDNDVRVMFQLVDTASRLNLWSNHVLQKNMDLALLAENIPRGIARALAIEITAADARRRSAAPKSATEVGDLVILGSAAEQLGPWRDNLSEAMRLFDEALLRDPHFTRAMLGVARVTVMAKGNWIELDPPVDLNRAERMLNEILVRAPNNPSAQYVIGQLQENWGHYAASIQSFEHALELNPSFIFANVHIGHMLTRMGRPDEGLERIQRYMRIAPPNEPALGYGYLYLGETQLVLGQKQTALELMLRANAFFGGSPRFQAWLAAAYAINGDRANAAKYAEAFRRSSPGIARSMLDDSAPQNRKEAREPTAIIEGLRLALANSQP